MPTGRALAAAALALALSAAGVTLASRAFRTEEGRFPVRARSGPARFPAALLPTLGARFQVGSEGGGSLLFAEGSVWASASANDGSGAGHVVRVDPKTNEIAARIPVAAVPGWVVGGGGMAAGFGSIWVTGLGRTPGNGFGALLHRIDPDASEVEATIPLDGQSGYDVAVDESGIWAMFAGRDSFTRVARIDASTNEVVATIELEQQWAHWIVPTEFGLLALEHRTSGGGKRAGVFTVIDPSSNEVIASTEPTLPGEGLDLAVWAGEIWTNAGGWELARIDPSTGEAIGSVPPSWPISGSEGLAAGEGGIWFVGYTGGKDRPQTLNRLNTETQTIDVSAEIGTRGVSIAAGAGAIWLYEGEGDLLRFDLNPPPDNPRPAELEPFVAPMVAAFLQSRVEGSGAEHFLPEGFRWDSDRSDVMPLYSPGELRYEAFDALTVHPLKGGRFQVRVRMLGAHLDGVDEWYTEPLFEETLTVGPGEGRDGQREFLLITAAKSDSFGSSARATFRKETG